MTFNEYQTQCLKTESPVDDGVRERFRKCGAILQRMMTPTPLGYHEYWGNADQVKKYIFYGRRNQIVEDLQGVYAYEGVRRDLAQPTDQMIRQVHAWLGVLSEVAEIAKAILSGDRVNIAEEFQDTGWYQAVGLDAVGCPMDQAAAANLNKLKLRYPEKFSQDSALNRDLIAERSLLDQQLAST